MGLKCGDVCVGVYVLNCESRSLLILKTIAKLHMQTLLYSSECCKAYSIEGHVTDSVMDM